MIEFSNYVLAIGNLVLIFVTFCALSSWSEWKKIAMRKSSIIENYEKEVRELTDKNKRLRSAVGQFVSEDDECEVL